MFKSVRYLYLRFLKEEVRIRRAMSHCNKQWFNPTPTGRVLGKNFFVGCCVQYFEIHTFVPILDGIVEKEHHYKFSDNSNNYV